MGGRIGVLLEVNCETDFVAKTEDFQILCHDVAMQIAAAKPEFVSREEVPMDIIESEKRILRQQALNEGKPEKIVEKMVEGRIDKYYKENCLFEQPFIKDTDKTVLDLINDRIMKLGEKISIRRFVRYEVGEGLAKRDQNFVDEVMSQIK
jgi:elongation factor Ts